jgi:hypothetical protein
VEKKWRDKYLKLVEVKGNVTKAAELAKVIIIGLPAFIPLLLKKSVFLFRYWRAEPKDKKKKTSLKATSTL